MSDDILKYIENEMTEQEKTVFENKLKEEANLQKEYFDILKVKKASNKLIELEIRGMIEAYEKGGGTKKTKKSITIKQLLGLTIGIICLAFILYYILSKFNQSQKSTREIYVNNYVEPVWPIKRSDSGDSLSIALVKMLEGNIDSSIIIINNSSLSRLDKMYWKAEIYAKNRIHLEKILESYPSIASEKKYYNRAVLLKTYAYLQQDRKEELKIFLREVDFNALSDETRALMNKIKHQVE
jgi:hypothetical protein